MKIKYFLFIMAGLAAASVLAGPPRTRATSQPKILRDQEIGQPFKPAVKPEAAFISDSPFTDGGKPEYSRGASAYAAENKDGFFITRGQGREFDIVVFICETDLDEALSKFSPGQQAVALPDSFTDEQLQFICANIPPGAVFRFKANEGSHVSKPYPTALRWVEGEMVMTPAFTKDGKQIKDVKGTPIGRGLGFFADIGVSHCENDSVSLKLHLGYTKIERIMSDAFVFEGAPAKNTFDAPVFATRELNTDVSLKVKSTFSYTVLGGLTREETITNTDGSKRTKKLFTFTALGIREIL